MVLMPDSSLKWNRYKGVHCYGSSMHLYSHPSLAWKSSPTPYSSGKDFSLFSCVSFVESKKTTQATDRPSLLSHT